MNFELLIMDFHGLQTDVHRIKHLTGSLNRISGMISSGKEFITIASTFNWSTRDGEEPKSNWNQIPIKRVIGKTIEVTVF